MQIPLILSDDAKAVVSRVKHTFNNGKLELGQLQSCWRPPSGGGRPWPDRRLYAAINEAEAELKRSAAVAGVAREIIQNGRLVLHARKLWHGGELGNDTGPDMLAIEHKANRQ